MAWSAILLLISGVSVLHANLCSEIFFVNVSKNWTEAQRYCRETYTDLVTIGNPEEMSRVMNTVNLTGYTGPVWIGLERGNSWQWQWSMGERRLYSDGQTGFSNWDSGAPHTDNGSENCVGMRDNGKWNNIPCDYKSATGFFVCYDGKRQTNQSYVFINQNNTNWMEAQRYCTEIHTDLVSVRNQAENNLTNSLFKSGWVWIGLYRDYWQWSDVSNSSFRNWAPGRPDMNYDGNQKCAVALITRTDKGRWEDQKCGESHPFICYDVGKHVTGMNFAGISNNKRLRKEIIVLNTNEVSLSVPLILVQQNMTWNDALNYCRENYVDLVLVRDKEVQQWVEQKVENATTDHVWMGVRFSCGLKLWFWLTGDAACYHNWAPGNRTGAGHCGNAGAVESRGGHQWVSLPETEKLNFICSK